MVLVALVYAMFPEYKFSAHLSMGTYNSDKDVREAWDSLQNMVSLTICNLF